MKYLDYFAGAGRGRVLADVLQSEQGAWFLPQAQPQHDRRGRPSDVPLHDDFCWLTLGQIGELLHQDNMVNMDARTVLSCMPSPSADGPGRPALDIELLSWFTGERARARRRRPDAHPLPEVPGWQQRPDRPSSTEGRPTSGSSAVSVQAGSREVTSWTQPLFEPSAQGVAAFLACAFDGVPHVLVHARRRGRLRSTPSSSGRPCSTRRPTTPDLAAETARPSSTWCCYRRPDPRRTRRCTPRRAAGSSTPRTATWCRAGRQDARSTRRPATLGRPRPAHRARSATATTSTCRRARCSPA